MQLAARRPLNVAEMRLFRLFCGPNNLRSAPIKINAAAATAAAVNAALKAALNMCAFYCDIQAQNSALIIGNCPS